MADDGKSDLTQTTKIALFRGQGIRKTLHENEWWFVVNDIVEALTDSTDPAQYFKRIKQRDRELSDLLEKRGGYNLYHPLCWRFPKVASRKCTAGIPKGSSDLIQSILHPRRHRGRKCAERFGKMIRKESGFSYQL